MTLSFLLTCKSNKIDNSFVNTVAWHDSITRKRVILYRTNSADGSLQLCNCCPYYLIFFVFSKTFELDSNSTGQSILNSANLKSKTITKVFTRTVISQHIIKTFTMKCSVFAASSIRLECWEKSGWFQRFRAEEQGIPKIQLSFC